LGGLSATLSEAVRVGGVLFNFPLYVVEAVWSGVEVDISILSPNNTCGFSSTVYGKVISAKTKFGKMKKEENTAKNTTLFMGKTLAQSHILV
jgi:hypothetical protein